MRVYHDGLGMSIHSNMLPEEPHETVFRTDAVLDEGTQKNIASPEPERFHFGRCAFNPQYGLAGSKLPPVSYHP